MEHEVYGCKLKILKREGSHICCLVPCADGGWGKMDFWELFPGVDLCFNDFKAQACMSQVQGRAEALEFNHCLRGRYECQFENHAYAYLGPGEIALVRMENLQRWSGFPLGEYYGLSFLIDLSQARAPLEGLWPGMEGNLEKIWEKFCRGRAYYQCRAEGALLDCLEGIYQEIPPESRLSFYRLRALELLEHLGALAPEGEDFHAYLPREKRERMLRVRKLLEEDLEGRLKLKEVAAQAGLGLTALKEQFQAVYGLSPMAFRRQARMRRAAALLEGTEKTVAEIAGSLGYENASKFSAAFAGSLGEAPAAYRRKRRDARAGDSREA